MDGEGRDDVHTGEQHSERESMGEIGSDETGSSACSSQLVHGSCVAWRSLVLDSVPFQHPGALAGRLQAPSLPSAPALSSNPEAAATSNNQTHHAPFPLSTRPSRPRRLLFSPSPHSLVQPPHSRSFIAVVRLALLFFVQPRCLVSLPPPALSLSSPGWRFTHTQSTISAAYPPWHLDSTQSPTWPAAY